MKRTFSEKIEFNLLNLRDALPGYIPLGTLVTVLLIASRF